MVQWLELRTLTAGALGSIPDEGINILQATKEKLNIHRSEENGIEFIFVSSWLGD